MKVLLCLLAIFTLLVSGIDAKGKEKRRPTRYRFLATAYSAEGITKRGTETHEGIVAADRSVLPLGTRIQVMDAGPYSGVYVVTDTGAKIDGRHIDIYLADDREAKQFGKQRVWVRVLKWGDDVVLPSSDRTR
jgi:3D (Asp-Asp-Asp) domain-containing protein